MAAKPDTPGGGPTPLVVTMLSPSDGETVSGQITWEASVSGGTAKRVDFAVDGTVSWSQTVAPYRYGGAAGGLDTTQLSNGAHTLAATAFGSKGAKGTSTISVTVANAPPEPDDPPPSPLPPSPLYWGAWIGDQLTGQQAPWDMNAVTAFEAMAGKPLSLVEFAAPFADCSSSPCSFYSFPTTPLNNVRQHGAIPFFSWSSQSIPSNVNEPDFQLSDVIEGRYDSYITSWAEAARGWSYPFFLRFNWEMNGDWFPWGETANGNQPGEYVAAWRHVHDIFTAVGANNVSWVWCPNVDPNNSMQDLNSLYPGDSYVDWTCLDGYNWGTNPSHPAGWKTFGQLYKTSYLEIVETIAPGKPMVIGETASTEYGGSKATWIQNMLSKIPTNYPAIRGVIWFEKYDSGMDWPIETSASSIDAFAAGIQDPIYTTNVYGDLGASPIPPPG